ncbi:MAG: hypothetical protein ACRDTH_07190 [Pseudonocardiaceae bacterium]
MVRVLGPDHPNVLATRNNLAQCWTRGALSPRSLTVVVLDVVGKSCSQVPLGPAAGLARYGVIGHHRPDGGDAALPQRWQKPAAHGGYGFVQMLYEPRRGRRTLTSKTVSDLRRQVRDRLAASA